MTERDAKAILADARQVLAEARAAIADVEQLRTFALDYAERELRALGVSVIHLDCDGEASVCLYARSQKRFAENLPTLRTAVNELERQGATHG
jgi:hypothetical protein